MNASVFDLKLKVQSFDIIDCLLEWYHNEGENFLNCIITGDETWMHHYDLESKHQCMQWKHAAYPFSEIFRMQASARGVMFTVFQNFHGPVFDIIKKGEQDVVHAAKQNEASDSQTQRWRLLQGVLFCTTTQSFCCQYQGNPSRTEIWSCQLPTIHSRLYTFWFSSVWTLEWGFGR